MYILIIVVYLGSVAAKVDYDDKNIHMLVARYNNLTKSRQNIDIEFQMIDETIKAFEEAIELIKYIKEAANAREKVQSVITVP